MKSRWTEIQTGFVNKPREAVQRADELVADAIKRLAEQSRRPFLRSMRRSAAVEMGLNRSTRSRTTKSGPAAVALRDAPVRSTPFMSTGLPHC